MEGYKHFSHPHNLSFHKSLEATHLTCTACSFPCTGTPIYSCRTCKFFLHDQCFNATRSLTHPSHPDHPLSLSPSPTYASGSFICNACNQTGSGLCFCCSTCEFDLHVHCAYNELKGKPGMNHDPPKKIQLKAHPDHKLDYLLKSPYDIDSSPSCDVCGTDCEKNDPLYHCSICGYDAHVECVSLLETVGREDHEHELSLLYVNPYESFGCDVCKGAIEQKNCMYVCKSGCDYGMHVMCLSEKVKEKAPMSDMQFQVEMFKLQNKMRVHQMALDIQLMGSGGYYRNRY